MAEPDPTKFFGSRHAIIRFAASAFYQLYHIAHQRYTLTTMQRAHRNSCNTSLNLRFVLACMRNVGEHIARGVIPGIIKLRERV